MILGDAQVEVIPARFRRQRHTIELWYYHCVPEWRSSRCYLRQRAAAPPGSGRRQFQFAIRSVGSGCLRQRLSEFGVFRIWSHRPNQFMRAACLHAVHSVHIGMRQRIA